MPLWRDNVRLGVGIDQGTEHLGSLPVIGSRGATQVRHGRLNDGVGESMLRMFMSDTNAGQTAFDDRRQPVTVSWDFIGRLAGSTEHPSRHADDQYGAAGRMENDRGRARANPIRFMGEADYIQQYGDSWGISLYGGDIVINRAYMNGGMRQAIILVTHELMHKMEFEHPPHTNYTPSLSRG